MILLQPAMADVPCVTMWLRPNRALTRSGMRRLIAMVVAMLLLSAGLGVRAWHVFAPLFAVAESAAVALALRAAWRAGDRGERITLDAFARGQRLPGLQSMRFQSCWVRVLLERGEGHHRLLLSSHGRTFEIGAPSWRTRSASSCPENSRRCWVTSGSRRANRFNRVQDDIWRHQAIIHGMYRNPRRMLQRGGLGQPGAGPAEHDAA